jgi:FkbM family methyltransferase
MTTFKNELRKFVKANLSNNYGRENFDEHRFGPYEKANFKNSMLLHLIKHPIKQLTGHNEKVTSNYVNQIDRFEADLDYIYSKLTSDSKALMIQIVAFRLLGYSKVRLDFNNKDYWNALEKVKHLKKDSETYDPHFMHFILEKFDLSSIGYDITIFFSEIGIAIDFLAEQYALKVNGSSLIEAEPGDVVLDIGGCWGDTALYFAHKVGPNGSIYSFEFIPGNIKLHEINTGLNPALNSRIHLIKHPVYNVTGTPVYFLDQGPGSRVQMQPFADQTGSTTTLTIDDFVSRQGLTKIDFIKMDIEGAEPIALQGAIETIRKFRPKLSIAIYHSMEDFVNIPKWILDLDLDYEIHFGHYTIHAEETILFAKSNFDDTSN